LILLRILFTVLLNQISCMMMHWCIWVGNFWQPRTLLHAVYVLVNAMSVDDKRKCPVVITVSIGAAISCSLRSLLTSSDDGGAFSRVKKCLSLMCHSLTLIELAGAWFHASGYLLATVSLKKAYKIIGESLTRWRNVLHESYRATLDQI